LKELVIALIVFLCLVGVSLGVLFSYEKLPAHHRHDDTQSVVRSIAGIFVVMTSLVLGLMLNSAKAKFEAINKDVHALATDIIVLDRTLRSYGREAEDTRQRLLAYVRRAADGTWTTGSSANPSDKTSEQLLNDIGAALRALRPTNDAQSSIWNDARQEYRQGLELRWALVEQAESSLPLPLLGLVIAWLILVFASFGYRAPRNLVVVLSFVGASALISGALYLIVDMDEPFRGPIQISPAPLQRALAELSR
jgi:hypothetical protein